MMVTMTTMTIMMTEMMTLLTRVSQNPTEVPRSGINLTCCLGIQYMLIYSLIQSFQNIKGGRASPSRPEVRLYTDQQAKIWKDVQWNISYSYLEFVSMYFLILILNKDENFTSPTFRSSYLLRSRHIYYKSLRRSLSEPS